MLKIKSVLSPTLDGSGQFTETFGEFEVVNEAIVSMTDPAIPDNILATSHSIVGNVITVTVLKYNVLGAPTPWVPAVTGDVAGCAFTFIVDGG